ncbi:acyl-CoA dehydrogenase [Mycolicibacter heraklionensis]|uniref:Acyl-CoA dehydrogenase n=1 Tax=Mycolicibacter heraklionensis TaxID=512402 RepID=A0ABR5FF64_9MYCO|nr:acyl-CoA dehydrogenase family protein [Mycolicibacter heraklionensis]KLO28745.1 acyl-CoA dehydrogenase [Mycolicibacter heraklionensis]
MTEVDSAEMALFASTSRSFLDKEVPLSRLRELHAVGAPIEPAWWRRAAELGWAGLLVPEELGGGSVSGNGVADLAMIAVELGRNIAPGPLHPVSTVLAGLVEAADGSAHEKTIEALVSGELTASWAAYEPDRPWAPLNPAVTVTAVDSGYRVDGVKDRVEAGGESDLLLVVARGDDGVCQVLVPTDAPGVVIEPEPTLDFVKRYARVQFDGVRIPRSAAVGTAGEAERQIERQEQIALLLQCAETVGILDTVLALTVQWAFDRHTFGRPLASYQALKHRFADMKMWLEACRATTAAAVSDIAARSPQAGLSASIAKSYVGERACPIVQDCIQLHGGIGVTWEHDLHLYLRRAALYRSLLGTPEEHNLRIYSHHEGLRAVI